MAGFSIFFARDLKSSKNGEILAIFCHFFNFVEDLASLSMFVLEF